MGRGGGHEYRCHLRHKQTENEANVIGSIDGLIIKWNDSLVEAELST